MDLVALERVFLFIDSRDSTAFVWMDFDSRGIPFSVMNELERAIEESSSQVKDRHWRGRTVSPWCCNLKGKGCPG